ncbi:hypothetical protein CH371_08405 [Leptospira wolffii]|uniref:DUF167 domain-containing protein n=1 Tax=Leptospira wolffii TaxID=409998 RepID=A0A2M9ZCX8_9LEPT|nr:DUF167 domain-containing protein [Leptospira wolffii]PJZ66291.1 hypothetical protein CH371_08405 [Leptospira wolffii]
MRIQVRIKPNSKKPFVQKGEDGIWIVAVREPALEGKANDALIRAVAAELDLPQSRVRLVRGEKSRLKILEIDD